MKTILAATLLTLLSLTTTAKAASIYKEGTLASSMYEGVEQVLPAGVTPIFILASDRLFFTKQIDRQLMDNSGVTLESLRESIKRVNSSVVNHTNAYMVVDNSIPGNEKAFTVCPIIFSNIKHAQNKGILFHEAVHCKAGEKSQTLEFRKAVSPAFFATKVLSTAQFSGLFGEALAAALQVAYAANERLVDGLGMVVAEAEMNTVKGKHNFGTKTAQHLLKLCGKKGACPTDTMAMVKKLTSDAATMKIILADMVARNDFEKANGIVIAEVK